MSGPGEGARRSGGKPGPSPSPPLRFPARRSPPLRRCPRLRLRAALAHHYGRRRAAQDPVSEEGTAGNREGGERGGPGEAGRALRARGARPGRGGGGERGESERGREGAEGSGSGPGRGAGGAAEGRRDRAGGFGEKTGESGAGAVVTGGWSGSAAVGGQSRCSARGHIPPRAGAGGAGRGGPCSGPLRARRGESSLCCACGGWDGERRKTRLLIAGRGGKKEKKCFFLQCFTVWFNNSLLGPGKINNCILAASLVTV